MDDVMLKSGTYPNVAIEAGSDPEEVKRRYGQPEADSREKLEADIRKSLVFGFADIFGWLDRQEEITEREAFMRGRASLDDEFAECAEEIAELTAERDRLTADLKAANDTCNTLRASVAGLKQTVDAQHRTINGLTDDVAEKRLHIAKMQRENARLRGECD